MSISIQKNLRRKLTLFRRIRIIDYAMSDKLLPVLNGDMVTGHIRSVQ